MVVLIILINNDSEEVLPMYDGKSWTKCNSFGCVVVVALEKIGRALKENNKKLAQLTTCDLVFFYVKTATSINDTHNYYMNGRTPQ